MLRLLVVFALFCATPAFADLYGTVRAIDGDTIDVGGTRIRLHAIDAPETDQMCGSSDSPAWPCGEWVRSETRALFDGKTARCVALDTDRYGRTVARCTVEGRDMGEVLVSAGLAFAYREYGWDYDLAEKGAAVTENGLHATGVTSPAAFRAAKRAAAQTVPVRSDTSAKTVRVPEAQPTRRKWLPNALNPSCDIKGNISRLGQQRIFHVPGQEYYDQTRISVSKGERWFCSEDEARAAGWRKARK